MDFSRPLRSKVGILPRSDPFTPYIISEKASAPQTADCGIIVFYRHVVIMAASSVNDNSTDADADKTAATRPTPRHALPCTSKRIAHVELFRPRTIIANNDHSSAEAAAPPRGRRPSPLKRYHLVFAVIYLFQGCWVYSTVGTPYLNFLDKAEREGFEGEWRCSRVGRWTADSLVSQYSQCQLTRKRRDV